MTDDTSVHDHWINIDPERMDRYEEMFQWNPATEHYYDAASIALGHRLADFGCGPGHAAVEFAKRVGPLGHVHAMDINEDFVRRTAARARAHGLRDRITAHLLADEVLPLEDGSLDRVIARNTIIYVESPEQTLGEFRRVLTDDGLAHMIESDWRLTCVEPLADADWQALIEAASWAWPMPEIGRRLPAIARRAGFREVDVQVLTAADTTGRLKGMIDTVCDYARKLGAMNPTRIDGLLKEVQEAIAKGTYLAVAPQFVVTAKA